VGNWPESWIKYWLSKGDVQNLRATIMFPSENQQFQQGQRIEWSINYEGTVYFIYPVFWNERGLLDTAEPGTKLLLSKYGASGDLARRYRVNPIIPAYPEPINPSKNEFSIEMGQDLVRAIAWQEWANSACNASDSLRWAHYCRTSKFTETDYVIANPSGDFGVMQINKYTWEKYFNNPQKRAGDYTGWDWTIRDWRENIRDARHIVYKIMMLGQTEQQKLWPEVEREYLAAYGYHRGEGPMKAVLTPDLLKSHYYTGDGQGNNPKGVIYYYNTKPWNNY